jgi:rhodanese-related sulfurtransferase
MKLPLVLFVALFINVTAQSAETPVTPVKRVTVEEFDALRTNTNYVLLDVRSKAEFEKGHVPRAVNVDISSPRFAEQVGAFDKSKTYLVNCAVGMRSARACKKMQELGFTNLFDLAPGFDGWKKAGKPVEK